MMVLLIVLLGGYFLYFDYLVPKYASDHIPEAWQKLDLPANRQHVHASLGQPDLVDADGDVWRSKRGDDEYQLRVTYRDDQRADKAVCRYRYRFAGVKRNYFLEMQMALP